VRPDETGPLASLLTRAFADDPVYRWMHPSEAEWRRIGPRYFGVLLRHFAVHGTVRTPEDGGAVAIWVHETPGQPIGWPRLALALRLSWTIRRRFVRGARAAAALASLNPPEPHLYLAILATDPAHQGRGLATSLLAPLLAQADAAGLPVRLETTKEANLRFYAARGFELWKEERVADDGPRIFAMHRPPGGAS
jgi:GNAT superfamily N-acetyltransferase